jgi:uncharacterized protein (DUF2267 family)
VVDLNLLDQSTAVAIMLENAATQIRKLAETPEDTAQLKTTRKACQLARDVLDGFVERLPRKAGKR